MLYIIKNENLFAHASPKQHQLASKIRNRIIEDLEGTIDTDKINKVTNSNYNKKQLSCFFKQTDDFKYFIEQRNINTYGIVISSIMKLKRSNEVK
ncbi:hypothetical protein [Staphylococcus gallinarum]|uniref:hypothetical protein n=1 Tax=Staphylococcus gallinarum TaxID=1293 RepID=UPI002DB9BFBE|nr:hypothetical protein [Staphylococcus gallinarum]MEB7040062.1 hypothetical protein [Staphylococcus gallinarum]